MREIKFRAWDKHNLKLFFSDWKYGVLSFWEEVQNDYVGQYDKNIMQSTGLKDKNGKEIYEGDIVKVSPENKRPRIVVWDKGAFHFRVPNWEKDKNMPSYPVWFSAISAAAMVDDMPEVIGNIYEHAELLNSEPNPEWSAATEVDSSNNAD